MGRDSSREGFIFFIKVIYRVLVALEIAILSLGDF